MKRGAEKQLVKGDEEEEEEQSEQVGHGFKMADPETLATRKIRGLPRKAATPMPTATATSSEGSPKIGNFAGFGSGSSSPFNFKLTPANSPGPVGSLTPSNPGPSTPVSFPSNATKAAQAIGSLLHSTPTSSAPESSGLFEASKKYFLSMRGLNRTFFKQLSQALEDDPFINLTDHYFEFYKRHLAIIETHRQTAEADAAERNKPAAPAFSKTFGIQSATPASSPFSFPPPKPTTSEPSKALSFPAPNGATFKPSASAAAPLNSPFGAATGASSSSLASPFGSTTTHSPFGTAPASSSSPFGGGLKPSSTLTFGVPSSSKDSETSSKPTTTQATSDFFATPPASAKGGPLSGFGGFKPTGSIGNPVGFGFGGSSTSKSDETEKNTDTEGGSSQETTASTSTEKDATSSMIGTSVHDTEGEGEEDEETTYSVKLKAFRMSKDKEGKNSWAELGVGFLRLKKHKETSARRMLLRNSSSGKIHINFNIYANLKPTLPTKKSISFIGHDEHGAPQSYLLRTKGEEQATELQSALEREIAFVREKGHSDA